MARTEAAIVAKYRDTERFKQALKIIKPASECREACERDLATALWGIDVAVKIKSVKTLAQYRADLRKLASKLRPAVELAAKAFPPEYQIRQSKNSWTVGEELKRHLKETEQAIDWTNKRVTPRFSWADVTAVDDAYWLLKKYGKKPRGVSHEGPWQNLAKAPSVS
jgi:hypothetical protein